MSFEGHIDRVPDRALFVTLGASLSYRVDEYLTLEAYADNITNTQYEEAWGYPALGINAGVSIKWEL